MAIQIDNRKLPPDVCKLIRKYAKEHYGATLVKDKNHPILTISGKIEPIFRKLMEATGMSAEEVSATVIRMWYFGPRRRHCRERKV